MIEDLGIGLYSNNNQIVNCLLTNGHNITSIFGR